MAMRHTFYVDACGDLMHYDTADTLRAATKAEERASIEAAKCDGGAGVIRESDLSRPVSRKKLAAIEHKLSGIAG